MHIYYFISLQGRQIEFGSNVRYVGYSSQDWSGWKISLSSFGHPTGSIVQRMSNFVWVSYQTVFSGIWCFQRRQLYRRYLPHIYLLILLTWSNNQFRNYKFEFSRFSSFLTYSYQSYLFICLVFLFKTIWIVKKILNIYDHG